MACMEGSNVEVGGVIRAPKAQMSDNGTRGRVWGGDRGVQGGLPRENVENLECIRSNPRQFFFKITLKTCIKF